MATGRRRLLCSLRALVVLSGCGNDFPTATLHSSGAAREQARSAGPSTAPWRRARFFVTGDRNPFLLAAIRRATDREISFDGRYSIAFVSCGTACGSYWFVDRHTGGVIEAPASPVDREIIWDIAAQPDSPVLKVTFGPIDSILTACAEQRFRLSGTAFTELGRRRPVECPR